MKRGLFNLLISIFFQSLKFENAVLFSPRDHTEMVADKHAFKRNVPNPLSRAFSEFIRYQIAMENVEIKYESREN